jgi:hypothetical protein
VTGVTIEVGKIGFGRDELAVGNASGGVAGDNAIDKWYWRQWL